MSLQKIKELVNNKNAKIEGIAGNGLDFKTVYITTENNYNFNIGGCNYKAAYKNLVKNQSLLYK